MMYQGKCYYCKWEASPCREREGAKEEIRYHIKKRHLRDIEREIGVLGRLGKKNILE
ncbi:MAG TPA: hypothetical protein VMX96_02485 [Dehalococcoidia bacterium]|nr:hypothetical protein [Dehalococcoidia bacterium]